MKKVKIIIGLLFLAIIVPVYSSQSAPEVKESTQEVIEQIDKKMSLFEDIMAEVTMIVDPSTQTARLTQAKKELTRLMKHSALSVQIKDMIKDDIEIIKTAETRDELVSAYQRLFDIYQKIKAQTDGFE